MVSRWIFLFSRFNIPQFDPIQPKNSLIHQKEEEGGREEEEEGREEEEEEEEEEGGITERLTFKKIADIERPKKFRTPVSRLRSSDFNRIRVSFTTLVFVRRRKPLQSAPLPLTTTALPLFLHATGKKTKREEEKKEKERMIEKEEKKG